MQHLVNIFGLLLISFSLSFFNADKKIVVIDVGHGGKDVGNVSNGFAEKDIVLSIAKKIQGMAEDENIEIILTRNTDKSMSLKQRADLANSLEADAMISLHNNAHHSNAKRGVELFISKEGKMVEGSAELAEKVRKAFSSASAVAEIKNANFAVLKNTKCPSVLVEIGFLSNDQDRDMLTSEAGQARIAKIILGSLK